MTPAPRASERAHHAERTEHRRDGSPFHLFADGVRHLLDQQRHQTANLQRVGQDRDHRVASARQYRPLRPRDARGARELPRYDQFSDRYAKFKVVYFISMKYKALMSLVIFAQDFIIPLGLRTCVPMVAASSPPTTTATTARPRRSSSSLALPTFQSRTASANGMGAQSWTWPGAKMKLHCQSLFGGKW